MLELLGKRVVLDIVNNTNADQLQIMVDPHQETVINFLMAAQKACIVVDGDFHETMHSVVHANGLRVVVLKEVSVQPRRILVRHNHVPARHRPFKVIFGKAQALGVHA